MRSRKSSIASLGVRKVTEAPTQKIEIHEIAFRVIEVPVEAGPEAIYESRSINIKHRACLLIEIEPRLFGCQLDDGLCNVLFNQAHWSALLSRCVRATITPNQSLPLLSSVGRDPLCGEYSKLAPSKFTISVSANVRLVSYMCSTAREAVILVVSAIRNDPRSKPILNNLLTNLLRKRYHGASNVHGVLYQLLYFTQRAFDLYAENAPDELVGEGLEDVDLRSIVLGNEYVQVKHYAHGLPWGKFIDILRGFLPVLEADATARFTIVTNLRFGPDIDAIERFTHGGRQLKPDLHRRLRTALSAEDGMITALLARLRFKIISEDRLLRALSAGIVQHFAVATGTEDLYAAVLFSELAERAGNRVAVRREDLENVRARVTEFISRGTVNPAVRDGFVSPIAFQPSARSDDYYEGRAARPDHIVANLDVPRVEAVTRITDALTRVQACIIVASSGQGKSTLAFRYAFEHYRSESVITVNVCQHEADVGQIDRYLRGRLQLGLPLLVLIDGLGRRTRLWHRLATKLADAPVSFLISTREEDWFRYRGETSAFTWDLVKPELTLPEAERIFATLQARGRVAPGVRSAHWAYERVREHGLLIEFVYLVTHGQSLAERLAEQMASFRALREDPAKIQVLRLVSVADRYGARVRVADLLRSVRFRDDPGAGIDALIGEYVVRERDYCVGLHPVRSDHLVALLHDAVPVEVTVSELIASLDHDELEAFIGEAFADPTLDTAGPLSALIDRCASDGPALLARMAHACFQAEERKYFLHHRHLFDEAYRVAGDGAVHRLAVETAPHSPGLLENLAKVDSTRGAAEALLSLARQFAPRAAANRLEHRLLAEALPRISRDRLAEDLPDLSEILTWCAHAQVEAPVLAAALEAARWRERLLDLPIDEAAAVTLALSRSDPESYRAWRSEHRERIVGAFKRGTRTFVVSTEDGAISIRFPVAMEVNALPVNEQAVNRLFTLYRLLPDYREYRSAGLYPFGEEAELEIDESVKAIPPGNIWLEVDTSKNATWLAICQAAYAADSLSTWIDAWQTVRRTGADFVRRVDRIFVGKFRSERADGLIRELATLFEHELAPQLRHAPPAPIGVPRIEQGRLRSLTSRWSSHMQTFAAQLLTNYEENERNGGRLLRVNLLEATFGLADLDTALHLAVTLLGLPEQMTGRDESEETTYRRLLQLLEYWFDARQRTSQPHAAARDWKRARDQEFLAVVRLALAPLEQAGYRFLYPSGPIPVDDTALTGLCLGFEVRDFAQQTTDIVMIAAALGIFAPRCDFIYLVPLARARRIQKYAIRIAMENAKELAQGHVPDPPRIYPVPLPASGEIALEGIDPTPLLERTLLEQFGEAALALARPLRLKQMAAEYLSMNGPGAPYERALSQEISDDVAGALGSARDALLRSIAEMEAFVPPLGGRVAWKHLVEWCRNIIDEIEASPDRAKPTLTGPQAVALEHRYMNAAYGL